MRVASFFAGIGGFDLGFERAGMQVVFQCERDAFCQKVLKHHWPDVSLHSDIRDLDPCSIPEADVWCGGFPCQDLSLANQGKRAGLAGKRSGLFETLARLAAERKPEWIVLENVPGLLNSHSGADFQLVLRALDRLGYFVAWRVLDAQYFGTPQRRRRVFIVGSRSSDGAARVLFGAGTLEKVAGEIQTPSPELGSFAQTGVHEPNLYSIQHATIGRKPHWSGPQGKGYRCDGLTYTLDSRGSSDVVCAPNVGFGIREATGISSELDARRLKSCGNAVCVHLAHRIAARILEVQTADYLLAESQTGLTTAST